MPVSPPLFREFGKMWDELRVWLALLENVKAEGLEWVEVEPSHAPSVVASDSSRHQLLLRYALIYAAQGVAVRYEGRVAEQIEDALVDFAVVGGYRGQKEIWEGLVSNRFKTLEVSLASRLRGDYVLLDGSYPSFVASRLGEPPEKGSILEKYYEQARKSWEGRISLLEKMEGERKLVFLSKSVSKAHLTEKIKVRLGEEAIRPPDFVIAEILSRGRGAGFLWSENLVYSIRTGGEERRYTLTYARFKPRGPLFQLTVPGEPGLGELRRIVSHLSYISPAGYPEPLAEAHHLSLLKYKEFKELVKGLGALAETGREVLEQLKRAGRS
ncbi:MAG: DNA double-strand break repair nuclease NurA [Acidilobaceae archaeon]